jgi:hypothetical protein
MDIKRAIELLETHNKWRRSEDLNPMVNPTDLGKCIDVIVEYFKNNSVLGDVSQQRELLKAFLEWQQNKYSMPYDTKIEWQIKDFEAFNCG